MLECEVNDLSAVPSGDSVHSIGRGVMLSPNSGGRQSLSPPVIEMLCEQLSARLDSLDTAVDDVDVTSRYQKYNDNCADLERAQ